MKASSQQNTTDSPQPSVSIKQRVARFYQLAKPGIVYGNALTTAAGFIYASHGAWLPWLFLSTVGGTMLIIASACVVNNYLDRGIDRAMARTKQRALVQGTITTVQALSYAALLGMSGFGLLLWHVNAVTALVGAIGFIDYVIAYGWSKRRGPIGTIVGSIAGATPVVAGYTALAGRVDMVAWWLFALMAIWQLPHFYAIALNRVKEYSAANIPVLPVVHGIGRTQRAIFITLGMYVALVVGFSLYGRHRLDWLFALPALATALYWAAGSWQGCDQPQWARRVFLRSLIALLGLCAGLALSGLLH